MRIVAVLSITVSIVLIWMTLNGDLLRLLGIDKKDKDVIVPVGEYKEYETPKLTAAIWYDGKSIGKCYSCGMSDEPVLKLTSGRFKCKWCLELGALNWHLSRNGVRRLDRVRATGRS